jgi:hypothetical protein
MHDDDEQVFVLSHARETDADERTPREIKSALRLLIQPMLNLCRAFTVASDSGSVKSSQFSEFEFEFQNGGDDLHQLPIHVLESGTQRFVPANQAVTGLLESTVIEFTSQTKGGRDIVSGNLGLELVEEPETFLHKRRRQRSIAGYGTQW